MSGKKARITVSLDPSIAAELKTAAERAGAVSVSEYVEGAVDARMVRERWLARWRAAAGAPLRCCKHGRLSRRRRER